MEYFPAIFFFVFGSMWGSFINALIHRIPRKIDIVFARSKCPKCDGHIPWYYNMPIIGYLILLGKCSRCKNKISPRYFFVELICALMSLHLMPGTFELEFYLTYWMFFSVFCCFVAHFFIDLEFKILPDSLNLYIALCFLIYAIKFYHYEFWLFGGLIGFLFPLIVTWLFYKLKGQVGLGGGDIKLYGALGLYLGPMGVMHNIFMSCTLGAVVGLLLILLKKMKQDDPIPFGPFILIVAIAQIYFASFVESLI